MDTMNWLILATIALPWLGAWFAVVSRSDVRAERGAVVFSAGGAVAALLLLWQSGVHTAPDGLSALLAAIAGVIGWLCVVFSLGYMRGEHGLRRYYAWVQLFIGAMCGLVLTDSLLLLFIFWEMTALCSFALIAFESDNPQAVAGGVRALVITQIGGVGLLVGVLTINSYLGTYHIQTFLERAVTLPPEGLALAAFGFLVAAAAKSAQVPFHIWLPGAMEAPTPISALIHAATMVNAGVYLLIRFLPAFAEVPGWRETVVAIGAITALMGALMALVSHDLKRVLAYSTVSQLGFMVYAVGAGGAFAGEFHLFNHAIFKALLFLGAGAVIHAVGTRDMREMGGLGQKMPFVCGVFIVGALALTGIPPLNGFWSKEMILEVGEHYSAAWLIMLAGAGLTALYSARMVWRVFFGKPGRESHGHTRLAMQLPLAVLAFGALTSWLPLQNLIALMGAEAHDAGEFLQEVLNAPVTFVALAVIGFGILLWFGRTLLARPERMIRPVLRPAALDFGFARLSAAISGLTQSAAAALRTTQTGQLNWNIVGIALGLLVVLALVAGGVIR